jgi:neutral trehalase
VDATSHVYAIYEVAAGWSERVDADPAPAVVGAPTTAGAPFREKARVLRDFIQNELFDEETGFFYDRWAIEDASMRRMAFEGMWPLVVGAATPSQARRVIDENLLNPARFFSAHPIATVGVEDPRFELRMWRGPTWNSMTYWAARGCVRYGHEGAACQLLERALDATTAQFERTGTVWEFYHPHGGQPEDLQRKPQTPFNSPCRDYLGHNPLIAMAYLYEECRMKNVE